MRLKRTNKEHAASAMQDQLAQRIAGVIIEGQRRLSNILSGLITSMPLKWLKWLLMAFCFVGTGLSLYLFSSSFGRSKKGGMSIRIDKFQKPINTGDAYGELLQQGTFRFEEYNRLLTIKKFLDSLKMDPKGRRFYDSILLTRPLLLDSLRQVENIYLQQYKK